MDVYRCIDRLIKLILKIRVSLTQDDDAVLQKVVFQKVVLQKVVLQKVILQKIKLDPAI